MAILFKKKTSYSALLKYDICLRNSTFAANITKLLNQSLGQWTVVSQTKSCNRNNLLEL